MSLPYLKFYPGDYLGDTAGLRTEEHGAYLLLLFHLWNAGGRCKSDPAYLGRVTGLTKTKFRKAWAEISRFFFVDGETIGHKRIDAELGHASRVSEVRKEARQGKKSPRPKSARNQKIAKNEQNLSEKRAPIFSNECEKIEENQRKRGTIDQQFIPTISIDMVSTPYGVEKPYLTPAGREALARLLNAAASVSARGAEARRLADDVTGFVDGKLTIGDRRALALYSVTLAAPLRESGVRLAYAPRDASNVIPLAKAV